MGARAFAVLVLVLVCLLALVLAARRGGTPLLRPVAPLLGGAAGSRKARALESQNLVVDTLNLAHWLKRRAPLKKVETCDILAAIETTAPILRRGHSGRLVYVTKDREARASKAGAARLRALYQAVARRCNVHVHVVERLPPKKTGAPRKKRSHAALGRDDFYLIMLARRYNCPVLSRDRFRDLADMKAKLDPFHVYSYSPAKTLPERDFVNPAAAEFRRMTPPARLDYPAALPHL